METYQLGTDYGGPGYKKWVWVCTNSPPRTYAQCNQAQGAQVWQKLRAQVGKDTFVMQSGCMLGCKPNGTSVAIAANQPLNDQNQHVVFLREVKPDDVDVLVKQYLSK